MAKPRRTTPVKFALGDAVRVDWVDIHNDESGWKPVSEITVKPALMKTLGWWIGDYNDHIVICADMADDGHTNTRMCLPKGCVLGVSKIKNA